MKRLFALGALALAATLARADCTLLTDAASGKVLHESGDCDRRTPPMSTFKIPISLMGFDAGILRDAHAPLWPFKPGYIDRRPEWKQATDPMAWMQLSVIWYSQQTMLKLGMRKAQRYTTRFGYGNADLSGGLTRAWLSSSLQISPREQERFLRKLVRRELGVSPHAYAMTEEITLHEPLPGGWEHHGKTGSGDAGPRPEDGAVGWYVGWLRKDDRAVIFVRQVIETEDIPGPAGLRARDAFLQQLPGLL